MSSFDNFYTRLQSLNEARKSPVEALVPGATGVTKQMRSAGLSSAPLDTIRFIRELLFNLDVISEEELNVVKMSKGFTGKKQAMLKVLQVNQDAINAKSDEIAQTIESTLDDFISGMGANRSREEKYAAQAAAQELAAQARAAKSGKEMDDALADVISDEKLLVKVNIATAIQYLEDLPAGEDLSPEVINNIKDFAKKINTIEQFESFVRQLSGMEEYQLPAAYLSSTVKAIKGGMEDYEMEDQEDPDHGFNAEKSDLDDDGKISEYERKRGEAIASSMDKEDGEDDIDGMAQVEVEELGDGEIPDDYHDQGDYEDAESLVELYRKDMLAEIDKMHKSMVNDGIDPTTGSKFSEAEISDLYRQAAERNLSKFKRLNKHSNGKQQDRVDVAQSILDNVNKTQAANVAPREDAEDEEEVVAESKYTTADYLTDIYSTVEPIIESTVNENGQTTPTQEYLVEKHEEAIEEVYTNQYLVEQKVQDSLPKQKKENNLSFKERFQPKTHWQLEEVRRYGL